MIGIRNESLQSLEIYVMTPNGPKTYWLSPNEIVTLPEDFVSEQIKILSARRMLKLFKVN